MGSQVCGAGVVWGDKIEFSEAELELCCCRRRGECWGAGGCLIPGCQCRTGAAALCLPKGQERNSFGVVLEVICSGNFHSW